MHVDDDRRARARETFLGRYELLVLGGAELVHSARAEEAHDARGALEGAEHDRDPPIFFQVRDRLDACRRCRGWLRGGWGWGRGRERGEVSFEGGQPESRMGTHRCR